IPAASGRGVRFLGADQNLSAFCQAEAFYRSMNSSPDQSDLFPGFVPAPQMVFVNDRVSFQTEAKQRVILVHGVAYSHYSLEDRIAEAYALVKLYESGYADQNDLARAFGYSTRTLRRFQQRLHRGGLNALIRPQGRPAEDSISHIAPRDRIILRLKAQGLSNRGIAGRIGLDEKMIRKTLRRLGWRPAPEATLPLLPRADPPAGSRFVVHPCAGGQWTAARRREDLRKPASLFLRPAHHAGGLRPVGSSPYPTPGGAQGIFPGGTGPYRGTGSHAGSENLAPETVPAGETQGQLQTRPGNRPAPHPRTRPRRGMRRRAISWPSL